MIIIPKRAIWTRQPSVVTGLDEYRYGGFADALSSTNLFSGGDLIRTSSDSSLKISQEAYGKAVVNSNTAQAFYATLPEEINTNPLTFVALIQGGTPTGGYVGAAGWYNESNNTGLSLYVAHGGISGNWGVFNSTEFLSSGEMLPTDGLHLVVFTRTAAGHKLFRNGVLKAQASGNKVGYVYTDKLGIGGDSWTYANGCSLPVYYAGIFLKDVWSDGYLEKIARNPWQIFNNRSRHVFVGASGGGGTDLYGAASGTSQASGTATLSAQVALAGVGVALAGGSAAASATVPISATGISVSGGDANLTATIAIAAAGLAQAAGAAGLSASVLLSGSGAALAAGNATLAAQLAAIASGSAQASGSATLSGGAPGAISAFGTSVAGGSGTLEVTVQLAATGGAQAGGTAMLSGGAPGGIAASGGAIAGGSGTLAVTVALTAAGFVQAMGAGAMLVSVQLVATGSATTGGSAVLRLLGAAVPVIDSRYIARAVRRDYTARYGQGSRYGRESG